uniref:Uncharacterized protein n=1 Tax=Anopheles culicifacies TaxID=139723 RepID=A0A182LTY1_9DIPT
MPTQTVQYLLIGLGRSSFTTAHENIACAHVLPYRTRTLPYEALMVMVYEGSLANSLSPKYFGAEVLRAMVDVYNHTADGKALLAFPPPLPVNCSVTSFSLEPFSNSANSSGEAAKPFGVSGVFSSVKLRSDGVRLFCDNRTSSKLRFCCFSLALEPLRCLLGFSCTSEPPRLNDLSIRWLSRENFLLSSFPPLTIDFSDLSESVLRCSMLQRYRFDGLAECELEESDSFDGLEAVRTCVGTGRFALVFRGFDPAFAAWRSFVSSIDWLPAPRFLGALALIPFRRDLRDSRRRFSSTSFDSRQFCGSPISSLLLWRFRTSTTSTSLPSPNTTDTLCVAAPPSTIVVYSLLSGSVQIIETGGVQIIIPSSDSLLPSFVSPVPSSDNSMLSCGSMISGGFSTVIFSG